MDSEVAKRLEESLQDPNWSGWFNSISKEQLWIELVSEQERIQNFYEDKIENLKIEEKRQARESIVASRAAHIWWFIVGGIVGTATGFFK
jgi:hypothetical protein